MDDDDAAPTGALPTAPPAPNDTDGRSVSYFEMELEEKNDGNDFTGDGGWFVCTHAMLYYVHLKFCLEVGMFGVQTPGNSF